jgi:antitoxin (DNA-binding transcriptional repressor) of toxin-antitoxin stability system
MRQVSLREFRTRGQSALKDVPAGETALLVGQNGPAFFLVPVLGDLALQEQDLQRALAKASLREDQRLAREAGVDQTTQHEIDAEIDRIRLSSPGRERECA